MPYKIKDNVIFRKEMDNLLVLSPKTKKLFVFKKNFADLVTDNGEIETDEISDNIGRIIDLLKKEEVI